MKKLIPILAIFTILAMAGTASAAAVTFNLPDWVFIGDETAFNVTSDGVNALNYTIKISGPTLQHVDNITLKFYNLSADNWETVASPYEWISGGNYYASITNVSGGRDGINESANNLAQLKLIFEDGAPVGSYTVTIFLYNTSNEVNATGSDTLTVYGVKIVRTGKGYSIIQRAVNNASANDIIEIPGVKIYKESVNVDKALTIKSASITYQDCDGSYCYKLSADGIQIYGINMYNATSGAVWQNPNVAEVNNIVIKACTIHDNTVGVNITDGKNNKIAFCNIYNNTNFGIYYGNLTLNFTQGYYIDGEYNYWYAEKGPWFCNGANSTSDFQNCTLYKVTNVTQGDKVTGTDYTPWLRAKVFDYKLQDVNGINVTVDALDVADAKINVSTSAPVRVFVAGFWGNPGTDFVTEIGRFVGIEFNDSSKVLNMTIDLYYTFEDIYGKQENTAKMYYWNGKVDDYWKPTSPATLDTTDFDIYTGKLSLYLDNVTKTPKANQSSDMMFGIGMYSDPIGGIALPADKLAVAAYMVASILAAVGIAVYIRRH